MGIETILEDIGNSIVRRKLNEVFGDPAVNPDNLVKAISEGVSLWDSCKNEVAKEAESIPPIVLNLASNYVDTIERKYGGFTKLMLEYLREDRTDLYSVIINTEGGEEWLDKQVMEILKGVGIIK